MKSTASACCRIVKLKSPSLSPPKLSAPTTPQSSMLVCYFSTLGSQHLVHEQSQAQFVVYTQTCLYPLQAAGEAEVGTEILCTLATNTSLQGRGLNSCCVRNSASVSLKLAAVSGPAILKLLPIALLISQHNHESFGANHVGSKPTATGLTCKKPGYQMVMQICTLSHMT